jgi:hypothetical protein
MIEGTVAIFLACLCFLVPMAIPLFAQRWRSFFAILAVATLFFGWLTLEMETPGTIPSGIGAFLGGVMLFGFAAGAIARLVSLIGRTNTVR